MTRLNCFLACLLGAAFFVTVFGAAANPCVNDQEFRVLTISCGGYVFCENRTKQEVICETGKVLERDSMACVDIGTGNTPCGTIGNCKGRLDGLNTEGICQTFYDCKDEVFVANSRRYCPKPLVFDGVNCNWIENVPEPCGTWRDNTV